MSTLIEKDKRHCWHPMTQHQTEPDPPVIVSASGASLYDEDGNEILDMISSWWTCVHGHSNPKLNKALADQAQKLEHIMFAGFSHPPAINLSEKLAQALPGSLNRVFYSDNGSTAVEIALKITYQYWRNKGQPQRTKFIAFEKAYHGETVGAMSVGKGCGFFHDFDGLLFDVETIPYVCTWDGDSDIEAKEKTALEIIKKTIEENKNQTAALIVEPLMQGAGGIRFSRPEFIKVVTDIAHANGILVIYDEVAVGFGRTGSLFACEKIGVVPDLICLSKGLTSGYLPMSVTVATDSVYDAFLNDDPDRAFLHSHTFTANPLACAVALRSLEMFSEDKILDKIKHIEQRHKEFLERLKIQYKIFMPRVMGSILAFNIMDEDGEYKNDNGELLREWFFRNGLNIRPLGNAVYLMPPYCITDEQLTRAYDGIFEGLETVISSMERAA
jgi:adenosylmethionine-8-amino-7-oxononanoate aminotransferase